MNTATITPEARLANAHAKLDEWLGEQSDNAHRIDSAVAEVVGWLEEVQEAMTEAHKNTALVFETPADRVCDVEMVKFPASAWDRLVDARNGISEAIHDLKREWEGRE